MCVRQYSRDKKPSQDEKDQDMIKERCVACRAPLEMSEERYSIQGNFCNSCCSKASIKATKRDEILIPRIKDTDTVDGV